MMRAEPSDRPVAFVGKMAITTGDVRARLQVMRRDPGAAGLPRPGSPEDRRLQRWVVQALVDEAVVAEAARALGRSGWERAEAEADVMASVFEHVTAAVTVPDSAVTAYHAGNPERYTEPERRLIELAVVADEAAARRLHARRAAGAAWPEPLPGAAGARDEPARRWVVRGELAGLLENRLFAARPGTVLPPVRTEFGWYVVELVAVSPARRVDLHAARDAIRADLLAAARGRRFDDWLAQRRAALARVLPGYEHPGDPRIPDHVHRH